MRSSLLPGPRRAMKGILMTEPTLTLDDYRRICYAKEFVTFDVHLKDGRRLCVAQPFATMIHPETKRIYSLHYESDPPNAREQALWFDLSEVARIELRPDLPWFDHGERRWTRRAG